MRVNLSEYKRAIESGDVDKAVDVRVKLAKSLGNPEHQDRARKNVMRDIKHGRSGDIRPPKKRDTRKP